MTGGPAVEASSVVHDWLALLFGDVPGVASMVTLPGAAARFFDARHLDRAAAYATGAAVRCDVYVGCCPLTAAPAKGRGGAADTAALVGVWADLDVAGPNHRRPEGGLPLPPTRAAALSLIDDLGLPPTAVVDTRGGLQVWWLLTSPWVFADNDDRQRAAQLSGAFSATLVELGRRRRWHVDAVGDLARMLRPPGTVNRKREPVPVTLVDLDGDRRYSVERLGRMLIEPEAPQPAERPVRRLPHVGRNGGESPAEAFSRLVSWEDILGPAGFALLYEHGGAAHWHHPASSTGPRSVSATTDAVGVPVLVVHSTSAAGATGLPVGTGQRLTKFRTWSLLHYAGDEAAAARALRQLGAGAA